MEVSAGEVVLAVLTAAVDTAVAARTKGGVIQVLVPEPTPMPFG